ncbi:MAG TPA: outer membrane beta-barrel protein [Longimicrobium sp.]|nr:outer membrane beta-barrel protein [Longimicrobium sp.]
MKRTLLLLSAAALAAAAPLDAQLSKNSGFIANLHLNGSSITLTGDDNETEAGGGLGFLLGYGVNETITIFFNFDAAQAEYADEEDDVGGDGNFTLAHGDLGVRVNFGSTASKARPFLTAAFTGIVEADDGEVGGEEVEAQVTGGGLTVGGGVQYFFSRRFALDAGVSLTSGSLTTVTIDDEDEDLPVGFGVTSARVQVGVSWHP